MRGPFRFGNNNFPVQDYHVYKVVKGGSGKPEFEMLANGVLKGHADAYATQCPAR
ncbi:hypothetical protein [Ottowia sp.]|uniref:hypothetical protein n=1 Tax=Ottowia sp. TaxID=1898956 RepID=UPI0039E2B1EE